MSKKPGVLLFFLACLAAFPVTVNGDEQLPNFSVGGLLFGDFYHVVSHHTEEGEGATGAVIRRGYLTFDADFTGNMFGRMRFELNQAGEFETYTFDTKFKDLFLGWNMGRQKLLLGLSPTPTFNLIESIWGLRYLARTPMDLQGVASRDTGVAVSGPINASGSWSYQAMLATGIEFGAESGDGRKLMGALNWKPAPGWDVQLYTDYEKLSGPTDRTTIQAFVSYQAENFRWGAQYSHQDRKTDPLLELASAFAIGRLGSKTQWIGRIDRIMEPSPKGNNISYLPFDPSARATFFIGGIEYQATPHLSITPNIVRTHYDKNDQGVRPETDLHLRLTLFLNFE